MTPPRDPLEEAASWAPNSRPAAAPSPAAATGQFRLEDFIQSHLKVRRGPVAWGDQGVKWELEVCPFNSEHNGSAVVTRANDGKIGFRCLHNSCADRHWADVRALFNGPQVKAMPAERRLPLPHVVRASELYNGELVRLRPLLADLVWDGLTMLVAKPKAGKSWLALQCAIYVAGGPGLNGVTALDHGPVLYAALEEPPARTMSRLRKLAPAGDWTSNLHFIYDLMPLLGGGAEQLEALIEQLKPRLVVLDTLTALIKVGGKKENDVFRSQYTEVSRVRKIAETAGTAVVLIHHARKGTTDTAIESVAGTGGLAAAVDTLWSLVRKPEGEGTLEVIGREAEEKTFALRFEQDPFGWQLLGDDAALLLSAERRQILELLHEEGALSPAQIAVEVGKSRAGVRMMVRRMREAGQVRKQRGKYIPALSQ